MSKTTDETPLWDGTWPTLARAQSATRIEFTRELAQRHHFVRCVDGRWCRTLGPPAGEVCYDGVHMARAQHVRGRVWHRVKS
jgi:hypothetical protein